MVEDISFYILDISNNSIRANAKNIIINLKDSLKENMVSLSIKDDGDGIEEEVLKEISNPFYTTRTTRKVGLGLSLINQLAVQCEGELVIESVINKGTSISLVLPKNHWDTPPLGDIADSIISLVQADIEIDYEFSYLSDDNEFLFDTKEIRQLLGDVSINEPSILLWLKDYIKEGMLPRKENI